MPCVYRRTAMIECGLDDQQHYAFDVFQHLADVKPYQRLDFRGLVQFAERAVTASGMELDMMVLSHGHFPPEVGARLGPNLAADYTPWADMIRSWALDFLRKMRVACSAETLEIIGLGANAIEVPIT